jgi:hypothetical protein
MPTYKTSGPGLGLGSRCRITAPDAETAIALHYEQTGCLCTSFEKETGPPVTVRLGNIKQLSYVHYSWDGDY